MSLFTAGANLFLKEAHLWLSRKQLGSQQACT